VDITIARQVNITAIHLAAKDRSIIKTVKAYAIMDTEKIIALVTSVEMDIKNETDISHS